jgi:hypothetical protein
MVRLKCSRVSHASPPAAIADIRTVRGRPPFIHSVTMSDHLTPDVSALQVESVLG